jgi:hypothetical protein
MICRSHTQQWLWFLEQLGGNSSVYNISLPRISGPLDVKALTRALNESAGAGTNCSQLQGVRADGARGLGERRAQAILAP